MRVAGFVVDHGTLLNGLLSDIQRDVNVAVH